MSVPSFELLVDTESFTLIEFDGEEQMNRIFEYRFTCEAPASSLTLADVINSDATFTIKEYDTDIYTGDIDIPGYISAASRKNGNWILTFLPKIHKSTINARSEIYFDNNATLTADTVIESELDNDILLEDRDYINNVNGLPSRKLFCQYNESNFNFVARLCDYWGIQFYFDHFTSNIVFANDSNYDQTIFAKFKTTDKTSQNHKLKIKDWNESIYPPHSYFTVIGHDHNNAGTNILSTYPDGDKGNLVEQRIINAGINSQAEADYVAQMRYEESNCRNARATGTAPTPYFFPGFKIETDDKDFSDAVVIKTIHKARNLNSLNPQTTPYFECEFEAIPDDVVFRPQTYYPIPQATTVLGKTITSATNSNLAERNEIGEYKVRLLGFEVESDISNDPWVRKAQTTGGTNSVDVPLTPETEVLLAFVDNNPNCPYIQHAMDNSLYPVPVNNENAHHAVLATDGMLVTSALQGRYNLTTTRTEERVDDSSISSSVKNYFKNRGDFDQNTNFIDPSTSNDSFTPEDRASGDYIITQQYGDQVKISQGDLLTWHNGNLYDFGGYWNYNLGNSYEENYLDQASQLNQRVSAPTGGDVSYVDLLNSGGPAFTALDWLTVSGKLKLDESFDSQSSDGDYPFPGGDPSSSDTTQPFHSGNINVAKTFNANSYELQSECNSITINDRVNSLEINHVDGIKTTELTFKAGKLRQLAKTGNAASIEKKWASNGNQTYYMKSRYDSTNEQIITEEKKWDLKGDKKVSESETKEDKNWIQTDEKTYNFATGALAAHNIKKNNGMGFAEMDFSYSETAISKFNFGGTKAFSLSAQGDASISISFSGSADLKIGFGLSMEIKTGVEIGMDLDLRTGSTLELDSKGKLEWSGIGFKARAEARAEAKQKNIDLENKIIDIVQKQIKVGKSTVAVENKDIAVNNGVEIKL